MENLMKTIKWLSTATLATALVLSATGALALNLGNLAGGLSGGGSKDGADMAATQTEVVLSFNIALKGLSQAQAKMAGALGLKEEAALAAENAAAFEAGSITGKDELSSKIVSSNQINEKLIAAMEAKPKLDEEAKSKFASSLPPFGIGVVAGINGIKKAVDSLQAATSDPMQVMKLGTLIYLAKEGPNLLKSFGNVTQAISAYTSYQGIDFTPPERL
jgi:hypothetical protein